jgi:hypothetical protein
MANENMQSYNEAKSELDSLMDFVLQIHAGVSTVKTLK